MKIKLNINGSMKIILKNGKVNKNGKQKSIKIY